MLNVEVVEKKPAQVRIPPVTVRATHPTNPGIAAECDVNFWTDGSLHLGVLSLSFTPPSDSMLKRWHFCTSPDVVPYAVLDNDMAQFIQDFLAEAKRVAAASRV